MDNKRAIMIVGLLATLVGLLVMSSVAMVALIAMRGL